MSSDDRGRVSQVSDDELVNAVHRFTPCSSNDVADAVGISRQAVTRRLENLEEREYAPVWSKKVGPVRVWCHRKVMPPPGG